MFSFGDKQKVSLNKASQGFKPLDSLMVDIINTTNKKPAPMQATPLEVVGRNE